MKDTNKYIYPVLIVLVIVIGVLSAMLISQNKKINDLETKKESEIESGSKVESSFEPKTYYVSKNEYIKFLDKENYELVSEGNKKVTGKYEEKDKEIKLDDSTVAYKKGDYLLIKDSDFDYYLMYYEEKKYDSFISDIKSSNIYDYVTQNFSSELKNQITKIEIGKVNECSKSSLDEDNFICSIDYKYYIKDYKSEKCSEYESNELYLDIIAGSSITCESDHIAKWSFFEFEKSGNKYKITNSFTGL